MASDVLIAVVITSLLRRRFGYRSWRVTHWLAYACFPIAVVHGLGAGSDAKTHWMLLLTAGCVLTVLVAVWIRVAAGWPNHAGVRTSAVLASIAAPVAVLAWLPSGPLGAGWAKRAGTPAALLAKTSSSTAALAARREAFNARVSGTVTNSQLAGGLVQVELKLKVAGQSLSRLDIRIVGQPLAAGGVAMTSSRVTLGPASRPDRYTGRVTALVGTSMRASIGGPTGLLSLVTQLQIDPRSNAVTGALAARPANNTEGDR